MARPITPTPPITGEDAEALAESIEQVASPEEIEQRREVSRRWMKLVTTPLKDREKKADSK